MLSVRKCGSSIANNICRALVLENRRCYVDVGGTFFKNNVLTYRWRPDPALRQLLRPGVIYGGFRDAPEGVFGDPIFRAAPKIIVIRDPRDALVSEYFSTAFSHVIPAATDQGDAMAKLLVAQRSKAQSEEIASFVLRRAKDMAATMNLYAPVLEMPGTLVVRYEDVILDKVRLIEHFVTRFGLKATEADERNILGWADQRPEQEDPHAFVRQVTPGDHKRKLDAPTIDKLNRLLTRPMRMFGYTP